jgi:uncharacterized protein (DUF427 family)
LTPPNITPVESVWDYPRPPRLEPTTSRIIIRRHGLILADTTHALRVLETSHPPVFYLPPSAIAMNLLQPSARRPSFCEFKGLATYWTLTLPTVPSLVAEDAAWSYPNPSPAFAALRDHLAFYANRLAAIGVECLVDDELVLPQPGDFYGGWITSNLRGPFKGAPGTRHW